MVLLGPKHLYQQLAAAFMLPSKSHRAGGGLPREKWAVGIRCVPLLLALPPPQRCSDM
jgi:hypothetical protein